MRFWLVTVGEPLPTDAGGERLLRAGILANALAARGHEIIWWTSAFNHSLKRMREGGESSARVAPNYRIEMLDGGGYRRNISFARIRDHRRLATRFAARAATEAPPDGIVCSFPPIELAAAAADYARARNVPLVMDVRDLWPDIFLDLVPAPLRFLGRMALRDMERQVDHACSSATAIWGNAPSLVDWGLAHAGRAAGTWDRAYPYGYVVEEPAAADRAAAIEYWKSRGIHAGTPGLIVPFFGALGRQFNLETVIDAARRVASKPIRFVICGAGERLDALQRRARDLPNVMFAGWRRRAEITTLLGMSHVGLAPYIERDDFRGTIPNKVPEYQSAGLAVAVSLRTGYLRDLIEHSGAGFSYAGSAETLAAKLTALLDDPGDLARMRARAAEMFQREFRADVVYGEMVAQLEALVRTGSAAR